MTSKRRWIPINNHTGRRRKDQLDVNVVSGSQTRAFRISLHDPTSTIPLAPALYGIVLRWHGDQSRLLQDFGGSFLMQMCNDVNSLTIGRRYWVCVCSIDRFFGKPSPSLNIGAWG